MHCLEMKGRAKRALHSLTATTLCQIDHIKATTLLECMDPKPIISKTKSFVRGSLATCLPPGLCMGTC